MQLQKGISFQMLPMWFLKKSKDLSANAVKLFCILISKDKDWVFHWGEIESETNMKKGVIGRALNELEKKGCIQRNLKRNGSRNKGLIISIPGTDGCQLQIPEISDSHLSDSHISHSHQWESHQWESYTNRDIKQIDLKTNRDVLPCEEQNKKNTPLNSPSYESQSQVSVGAAEKEEDEIIDWAKALVNEFDIFQFQADDLAAVRRNNHIANTRKNFDGLVRDVDRYVAKHPTLKREGPILYMFYEKRYMFRKAEFEDWAKTHAWRLRLDGCTPEITPRS